MEVSIAHVSGDNLVVLGHTLDHQFLDQFADARLEFAERVVECRVDDLQIFAGLLFDLLEEEPVPA